MNATTQRCRGLTLLELLLVMGVLLISISCALELTVTTLRSSARSQRIMRASVLAQNELEYWRAQGGAKLLALGEGTHPFQNPVATRTDNQTDAATVTVRRIDDTIVEATAVVSAFVGDEKPADVSISTYLPAGAPK